MWGAAAYDLCDLDLHCREIVHYGQDQVLWPPLPRASLSIKWPLGPAAVGFTNIPTKGISPVTCRVIPRLFQPPRTQVLTDLTTAPLLALPLRYCAWSVVHNSYSVASKMCEVHKVTVSGIGGWPQE